MTDIYVEENPFIDYGRNRVRRNKNFMIIIVGATGSGKSYCALRLGEIWDSKFNISRVAFNGKDFIELADKPELKPGSVIVLDEAGISMDNRTWWATHNRMINWLLQTFRHRRLITILTVPQLDFIDKKSLALFHAVLEVTGISSEKRCSIVKPKIIVPKPATLSDKNFLMIYPTIKDKSGSIVKIDRLHVHLPSLDLRKDYEKVKSKFTKDLRQDSLLALSGQKIDPRSKAIELAKRERELLVIQERYPELKDKDYAKMMNVLPVTIASLRRHIKDKNILMHG